MKHPKLFLFTLIFSFMLTCNSAPMSPPARLRALDNEQGYAFKEALPDLPSTADLPTLKTYQHPAELFSYQAPVHWRVENSASGVAVYSPNSVAFSAFVIHTGYRLSSLSFLNLAANVEAVNYSRQTQYEQLYRREDQPQRSLLIEKTFIDPQGVKRLVTTIYRQMNQSVYVVEITGEQAEILADSKYLALFQEFNDSIQAQAENSNAPTYAQAWTFSEPNDFSLDVPLGWKMSVENPVPNITHIQFDSPDHNANFERVFWDYGQEVRLKVAAQYALELIKEQYTKDADDLKITSEIILESGKKERITWVSRFGGYSGVMFFEIRNQNQIFILSQTWNRLFEDIYAPVIGLALESFTSLAAVK